MNIVEGTRRIRMAGKYILFAAAGVFVALLIFGLLATMTDQLHVSLSAIVFLPLLIAVPGASLYFLGWIIEGFSQPAGEKSSREA
jgi:hypothetical protein